MRRAILGRIFQHVILLSAVTVVLLASSNAAYANSFSFSLSGTGVSGSGTFTTGPLSGGSYLVTGLTGTLNGQQMTLLSPGTNYNSNNLLYPTSPFVDQLGIEFSVAGLGYNLYGGATLGANQDFLVNTTICSASSGGCGFGAGTAVSLSVSPSVAVSSVPEPPTMLLTALGLLAIAGTRRSLKHRLRQERIELL